VSVLTVMPIDRAVPGDDFSALSRSLELRSAILRSAISRTWARLDRTDLVLLRDAGALGHTGGRLQELGGRRRLEDERERTVFVHADLRRNDRRRAGLRSASCSLAELHDVHAVLTERGTDGGAGVAMPAFNASVKVLTSFFFGGMSLSWAGL